MDLISVRELFKNTDAYAGKEVEVGVIRFYYWRWYK